MPVNKLQKNGNPAEQQQSFISLMLWAISLSRPYRKWVFIILIAMLLEAIMSVATPWPLKIIIDDIVGQGSLPKWLHWVGFLVPSGNKVAMAALIAFGFILINFIGSLSGYINSYYNEN